MLWLLWLIALSNNTNKIQLRELTGQETLCVFGTAILITALIILLVNILCRPEYNSKENNSSDMGPG